MKGKKKIPNKHSKSKKTDKREDPSSWGLPKKTIDSYLHHQQTDLQQIQNEHLKKKKKTLEDTESMKTINRKGGERK